MNHITIGKEYSEGKIAYVSCFKNENFKDISIKDECFLLIIATEGTAEFTVGESSVTVTAPAFVCFNEKENPVLKSKRKFQSYSIYFHPKFLNVNMSFELLQECNYINIAHIHDMFLLKPFTDGCFVVPIIHSFVDKLINSCEEMKKELTEQRDWYWSCRGRSYFMEIIIALERMYGIVGSGTRNDNNTTTFKNNHLRQAAIFIESRYSEEINLKDIAEAGGINHSTLTALFKEETNMTATQYLQNYRISVAKKQLEFTDVPMKDIARRCGFKTVQHFNRIFKNITGSTPATFRTESVEKRKNEFKKG